MDKITKSRVLELLLPMYNVRLEPEKDGKIFVVKDDVKFGFIKNKILYLMNDSGHFTQVIEDINNPDKLLIDATKSFWYARSRQYADA